MNSNSEIKESTTKAFLLAYLLVITILVFLFYLLMLTTQKDGTIDRSGVGEGRSDCEAYAKHHENEFKNRVITREEAAATDACIAQGFDGTITINGNTQCFNPKGKTK